VFCDVRTDGVLRRSVKGVRWWQVASFAFPYTPLVASAAPYAGLFQDLLQTLFQAMLAVLGDTPSPGEQPRQASAAKNLPSQHAPSVPHRPPILLLPTLTIV
jgi:hypothetical protein